MQFLGGDPDLGTETELLAVGERSGGVHHHRRCIHPFGEAVRGRQITGDDRLGMAGAVGVDVLDGIVETIDECQRNVHREKLGAQLFLGGIVVHGDPGPLQGADEPRSGGVGDAGVDQQCLSGIADTRATGFGVQHDSLGDVEVGVGVNVDVAVTDTGLNGRHGRVTDDGVDQSRSPTRDHHIDKPSGLNERGNAGSVGTREQLHRVGGQAFASECTAQHCDQCRIGCCRRRTAAQQYRIAGFERQSERIDGHVGSALVDDPHHAQWHPLLTDLQAVGQGAAPQHLSDRVG